MCTQLCPSIDCQLRALYVTERSIGNLCGGLFTILMLIIMFSVAHRRFQELVYISLAFIAITLTLCIIFAIFNTLCKGDLQFDMWDTANISSSRYTPTRHHSRRQSSRYHRHYSNNNNNSSSANNAYNQQRVHVCAPPSMGGARLNIIYTIGQQSNHTPRMSRSLGGQPLDRHSVAINIDDNSNYSAQLWPPGAGGVGRSPTSRASSPRAGGAAANCPPQYLQFSPIITVIGANEANDDLQQLISTYGPAGEAIDTRLPINSDILSDFDYQYPDMPPLYHQLDVIPTDGPPSYEDAIKQKTSASPTPQSPTVPSTHDKRSPSSSSIPHDCSDYKSDQRGDDSSDRRSDDNRDNDDKG
ncbi:uncharacterized protein LOC128964408 [Oppia nitens]|uniref:uncharacterized protein LOC128964408 n=1 Tax=Oppia nitens TaxID=1686743 RepID=UPI0023DC5E00|nr:uncharacterized protein LOC128964408 [Oppia nitens]